MRLVNLMLKCKICCTRNRLAYALIVLMLCVGLGILYFFSPTQDSYFPPCWLNTLTGWYCPGCGTTRALHALLHGEVRSALQNNAFTPWLLPFVLWLIWKRPALTIQARYLFYVVLGAWFVYTLLRNLPFAPFNTWIPIAS